MTHQEIFDKVVLHLINQRYPAMSEDGECQYRDALVDGTVRRCAVGIWIPDEDYTPDLEGFTIPDLTNPNEVICDTEAMILSILGKQGIPDSAIPLLAALQNDHDHQPQSTPFERHHFAQTATRFSLTLPEIEAP